MIVSDAHKVGTSRSRCWGRAVGATLEREPAAGLGVLTHSVGTATQGLSISYPAKTLRHEVQSSVCKDALRSVKSNREKLKVPKRGLMRWILEH